MEDKPSINKGNKKPVNPSKRKNPRLINRAVKKINGKFEIGAVIKKPRPLHNESLIKGEGSKKSYNKFSNKKNSNSKVNMYGAFKEDQSKKDTKTVMIVCISIFVFIFIIIGMIAGAKGCDDDKKVKEVFKGKEYFSYLGIHDDTPYEDVLYETDDLAEVDGIALGVFSYDGEEYYRFQAIKNGIKAYDSEITNRQGTRVSVVTGIKPTVEVYKRTYTKENNDKQTIYYYKLYVPDDKLKKLS